MRPMSRHADKFRADPAPSRWSWRVQRLMLTPGFRLFLRAGLPFLLVGGFTLWWLSQTDNRQAILDMVADLRTKIEERPEFMVNLMAIDGADPNVSAAIRALIPIDFPVSSFDLDLPAIRQTLLALDPVRDVSLRIRPGGVLQVDVDPRVPALIWREPSGLTLLDETGARIAPLVARVDRPDLPLIAGSGAAEQVQEALALINVAKPLGDRLRGVVRVGERRWDIVLDRGQRILLPETGAIRALERVLLLEDAQEMLSRDVAQVDMRLGPRPTLRMTADATAEWWRIRSFNSKIETSE
ncbi:MAG: cell division protein FtsQ/DivIB [Pseudomonadota bacterium]